MSLLDSSRFIFATLAKRRDYSSVGSIDWRDIELYAWSSTGRPPDGRDEKLDSLLGLFRRKY